MCGLLCFQIGINPGLTAAYVGHHYAGPGNHFCKKSSSFTFIYLISVQCRHSLYMDIL